jgi:hypothetical protein
VGPNRIWLETYYICHNRNCCYALRQISWYYSAQEKIDWQAKPSTRNTVGSDFRFCNCGEFDVAQRETRSEALSFQNVMGLWFHIYTTFVVNAADPLAYLNLIRSPAKTVIQTGQLGAIILADALVVRSLPLQPSVTNLINLYV